MSAEITADGTSIGTTGRWLVRTRGSTHLWDMDARTVTRTPGPDSGSGSSRFDGVPQKLTRIGKMPTVGSRSLYFFDDPDDPGFEHWRLSSVVAAITPLSD